jgi:acetyl-CoA C-acetyltransferase
MTLDPRTPVLVGAGQALRRDAATDDPAEPVALIVEALREAAHDSATGDKLLRAADSVRCVPPLCWYYRDPAALIAEDLGAHPRETVLSAAIGGDGPQALINDTARAIAAGEIEVALLAGAEAVTSVLAAQREGPALPWRQQDEGVHPTRQLGEERAGVNDAEAAVGLAPPVAMYALIESAIRTGGAAAPLASPDDHLARIAGLWSRLSDVAAQNPHAWLAQSHTAAQIAEPTDENRLVCSPYTKLLTANIQVNMAAGLIVTSAGAAERAGVPRERWVFVHAGAQAYDEWHVSERERLDASPAIRAVGHAACEHAGIAPQDVAHVDLYSCFPAAVQIAAHELGLPIDDPARPLTVTGGLTFAGGPGNNYSMHAVAALVPKLREDLDAFGLSTALGWYVTKHAAGVYSARAPRRPFVALEPTVPSPPARRARHDYAGPGRVEACTVSYRRDGTPEAAVVAALTPQGERALIRTPDEEALAWALTGEPIGTEIEITPEQQIALEPATR